MKIQVTQEDIDNGIGSSACLCPVALAIKRRVKQCEVFVDEYSAMIVTALTTQEAPCPESVGKFIQAFDEGLLDLIQPFEFELDLM